MSACHTEEIKRLRQKADECRAEALNVIVPEVKLLMLRLAQVYDHIAETYQIIREGS